MTNQEIVAKLMSSLMDEIMREVLEEEEIWHLIN